MQLPPHTPFGNALMKDITDHPWAVFANFPSQEKKVKAIKQCN